MLNNKNGQVIVATITTGMVIVFAVIIALLFLGTGGLLYYIVNHAFVIGGFAIIVLTLVYGLPQLFKDPTNKKIVVFFVALLFGGLILSFQWINLNPVIQSTYYDQTLGLVEEEAKVCGFFCNVAPQVVTIPKTQFNLGESITARFQGGLCTGSPPTSAGFDILNADTNHAIATYKFALPSGLTGSNLYDIKQTFTPTVEGSYKIRHYWVCQIGGRITDTGYMDTITVKKTFATCPGDAFVTTQHLYQQMSTAQHVADYTCSQWEKYELVNGACNKVLYCKSYTTFCDSGYVAAGTTTQVANGLLQCALETKPITNTTTDPISSITPCGSDVIVSCADGSSVIVQKCHDGVLTDVNNKCPTTNVVTNKTVNTNVNSGYQSNENNTTDEPITNTIDSDFVYLWVIIGIISILVIILVVLVVTKFKR